MSDIVERLRREIELRLSVSTHRQHYEGIASLFMTQDEIDAENRRYDEVMAEIEKLREKAND